MTEKMKKYYNLCKLDFSHFINLEKYVDGKYRPKIEFCDLGRYGKNWSYRTRTSKDDEIDLWIMNCGGFADMLPLNSDFSNYLCEIAKKNELVIQSEFGPTGFTFKDYNALLAVFDYAGKNAGDIYSIDFDFCFFNLEDFEQFREEILESEAAPEKLKTFMKGIKIDFGSNNEETEDYDFEFYTPEGQRRLFSVFQSVDDGIPSINVFILEKHYSE